MRSTLLIGLAVSLLAHVCIMLYLASRYQRLPASSHAVPVQFDFALVTEEDLTDIDTIEMEDQLPEITGEVEELPDIDAAGDLEPLIPSAQIQVLDRGSIPSIGGAGDGLAGAARGGGAGTSFFGLRSSGTRFAYIVDRSGSMGSGRKMETAKSELARSVEELPDYGSFHIVFYSSGWSTPPMQRNWIQARRQYVSRFIRWLDTLHASGGTAPYPAFEEVFQLTVPPDVIFFLTDGEIPASTAQAVLELNRRAKRRVVINTIAFGDPSSQDQLRQIARESGGAYRFVPVGGP